MTLEEFHDKYHQELNLARQVPLDIYKAVGESFGITITSGETHGDYLNRLGDYLESIKVPRTNDMSV